MRSIVDFDARLSNRLRVAEQPGLKRSLAVILAHSGDSWFWGVALLTLWWAGGMYWKKWAVMLLGAIIVLAAVVLALKFLIRRRRPEGNWGSIYRNTDPHSFPSGHAARAFLLAVLVSGLGPAGIAIALWIWAPLVSLARVAMGVHYVSDVVAGLVLGIFMGILALQVEEPAITWVASLMGFRLW